MSLCKHLSSQKTVENFFHRKHGIVEKYPEGLPSGGKVVWKTLWKMFITLCTGNYPSPYVNRRQKSARKTQGSQTGEKKVEMHRKPHVLSKDVLSTPLPVRAKSE